MKVTFGARFIVRVTKCPPHDERNGSKQSEKMASGHCRLCTKYLEQEKMLKIPNQKVSLKASSNTCTISKNFLICFMRRSQNHIKIKIPNMLKVVPGKVSDNRK